MFQTPEVNASASAAAKSSKKQAKQQSQAALQTPPAPISSNAMVNTPLPSAIASAPPSTPVVPSGDIAEMMKLQYEQKMKQLQEQMQAQMQAQLAALQQQFAQQIASPTASSSPQSLPVASPFMAAAPTATPVTLKPAFVPLSVPTSSAASPFSPMVSSAAASGIDPSLRLDVASAMEKLNESLVAPLELIDQPQQIAKALRDIKKRNVMAVDCEGVNMDRRGKLCVVSVCTSKKRYAL
jgi:hypothetical protein